MKIVFVPDGCRVWLDPAEVGNDVWAKVYNELYLTRDDAQAVLDVYVAAYQSGRSKGFKNGYHEGYREGREHGYQKGVRDAPVLHLMDYVMAALEITAEAKGVARRVPLPRK